MPELKNRTALWLALAIALVVLAAIVLWALIKSTPSSETPAQNPPQTRSQKPALGQIVRAARTWQPAYTSWIGQTAPDFTLTDLNGKQHKLSDYRGKNALLVFWATWCRPCIMEIPHLIELRNITSKDQLAILAISQMTVMPPNTLERIKNFMQQNRTINYTVLPARASDMPAPYSQVQAIPCSFFIDPQGKIKLATEGLISLPEVKAILEAE